ncbi:MAG: hypothetical protein L6Q54_06190 [Leptospiraceae bacterium]|nr:hypothetical protein [Leptospiraceae bacterium]MCK6380826.1 hypothetical protein [Leptospiraceae bacterium]NUM40777.1 hypothetical protein [Leptospiraceae bacterium]
MKEFTWLIGFLFLFNSILSTSEIPIPIIKAAEKYRSEREKLKTYQVEQEILTTTIVQNTSESQTEKRKQIGYFVSPNKYYFLIKEKKINGIEQEIYGNLEKTERQKNDWLSKNGMSLFRFQVISYHDNFIKYSVTPKQTKSHKNEKGEIWIRLKDYRIKKIISEPVLLGKEIQSYQLSLNFEDELEFQEPSQSILNVVLREKDTIKKIRIQADFRKYKFNTPIPSSITR